MTDIPKYKSPPIIFTGETMTQQHQMYECDINNIMAKYQKSGVVDHINEYEGQYHDCDSTSFHEAQNIIANANSMFADLPSTTRKNFDNDPAKFFDYVQDPKNADSLVNMGLAHPPKVLPTDATPSAPADPTKPASAATPPNSPTKTTKSENQTK